MHALVSDIVAEWVRGAVLDAYGAAAGRQAFGHVLSLRCEVDYILSTELTTTIGYRHELTHNLRGLTTKYSIYVIADPTCATFTIPGQTKIHGSSPFHETWFG